MKITFPHMGNMYIVAKALLDEFSVDYVIPPFNNKNALEIGTRYAPETACLPLKLNIGNLIEAHEMGADCVFMVGGFGPCRFGYYGEMEREILKDTGFEMDFITLEMPNGNVREFMRRVRKLTGSCNVFKILKAVIRATGIAKQVDDLERLTFKIRPREVEKGSTDRIYRSFQDGALHIKGAEKIKELIRDTRHQLLKLEINRDMDPIKVGIVGEIFTNIDSHTSFNIESKLGNMGIEVDRSLFIGEWIIEHIFKNVLPIPKDLRFADAAKPYLGAMIGGHARETIGHAVLYAQHGYDGIIQIYPLTCMPEIVAQSILPAVEKDFNIPILTLIIDEMTAEVGYLTRIEAFIDLLCHRREKATFERKQVLSRS